MEDGSLDESSPRMEEEQLLLIVFGHYLNDFRPNFCFEVTRRKALIPSLRFKKKRK